MTGRTSGRVVLVGAGPGDPGLLTLRGQRWLAAADVVVHDHLVHRRLLESVRPDAEIVLVGAPHQDGGRLSQSAIEDLLVDRARSGKVVVRLKNGDPFVFGRGAEEAEALRRAGIPFEVVPGVTAAVAVPAYAGIPATHRDHASLVTIATGHQAWAPGAPEPSIPQLPWDVLAKQGGTLVFVMAVRQLAGVLAALVAAGLDAATPAALVHRGTLGSQRTIEGTAATLAARVREAGVGPPAVLVVGQVVSLREQVRWFEERPLFGRRVVVTRPREQAGDLARALEDAGAEVVLFPTIAIAPPLDPVALDRAVAVSAGYDWIVFTSANGVRAFFARFAAQQRDVRELAPVRLAAIGPETAAELERRLLRPAVVPLEYRAEGLLEALAGEDLRGRRILLPRAAGARPVLPETLVERGASVDEVIAYRAVAPADADVPGLRAALAAGDIDAVTFTSSSTVRHFVELVGRDTIASLGGARRPVVACIGPVTAETAREAGLAVDVCPVEYTAPSLAAALVDHFCNATGDRLSRSVR
jgi:uroporphyrinogen III methyltransferase / synthase